MRKWVKGCYNMRKIVIYKKTEHITFKAKIERKEKPSVSATLSAPGVEQKGKHTLLISK